MLYILHITTLSHTYLYVLYSYIYIHIYVYIYKTYLTVIKILEGRCYMIVKKWNPKN